MMILDTRWKRCGEEGESYRQLNAIRVFLSLILAVYLFFCLSYDLSTVFDAGAADFFARLLKGLKTYGAAGNILTLLMAAAIYSFLSLRQREGKRFPASLILLAILFALLNTASLYLFYSDSLPGRDAGALGLFFAICGGWAILFLFCSELALLLFARLGRADHCLPDLDGTSFFRRHFFMVSFLLILLAWLPWIVSFYPASMEWDVYDPILRYLRVREPTDHHPWLYACAVGSAYQFGVNLGDKNVGVFLYIIIRAIAIALIYARCLSQLQKRGLPFFVCVCFLAFYAFTPVWGSYAKHAFKDTIGAALFCWYVVALVEIVHLISENRLKAVNCFEYTAAALISALFRNNSIYVVFPISFLLAAVLLKKKQKLHLVGIVLLGIVCFEAYHAYIYNVVGVQRGSSREALSIPFQQTARTVKYNDSNITDDERITIHRVLIYPTLSERYDPIISDPVKDYWHGSPEEKKAYLKIWAEMAFKYPRAYMEAFIAHSSGYYAFTPEYTEAQRYGTGSHANVGMTYFDWVKDPRFEDDFTCDYIPSFEGTRSVLSGWAKLWHQIPVLNLTDTKPLYTWLIVLMSWLFIKRKEYLKLLPPAACLLMVLTCMASPVNDCFRYFAPVAAAFPGLFSLLREDEKPFAEMER